MKNALQDNFQIIKKSRGRFFYKLYFGIFHKCKKIVYSFFFNLCYIQISLIFSTLFPYE